MENTQTMDNSIVLLVGVGGQGTILAGDLLATLMEVAPAQTAQRFKLALPEGEPIPAPDALLEMACKGRGWLLSGGRYDTDRAAALVLDEFRGGKVGKITLDDPRRL